MRNAALERSMEYRKAAKRDERERVRYPAGD